MQSIELFEHDDVSNVKREADLVLPFTCQPKSFISLTRHVEGRKGILITI